LWEEYKWIIPSHHFIVNGQLKSTRWRDRQRILETEVDNYVKKNPSAVAYFATIQKFMYPERTKDEKHWSDFFIDLDSEILDDAYKDARIIVQYFLEGFDIEPKIWFSGNKGFHITVPGLVFGAEPDRNLTYYWRHLADRIVQKLQVTTLDERVYSRPRMWRLEGTKHPRSNFYKTPLDIASFNSGLESIMLRASSPPEAILRDGEEIYIRDGSLAKLMVASTKEYKERRELGKHKPEEVINFKSGHPACVRLLLDNGLIELGTKNRADMALSGYCKASDISIENSTVFMTDWAKSIPESLTHEHDAQARVAQSLAVLRTVLSQGKYSFSCGSILACGINNNVCKDCPAKNKVPPIEIDLSEYSFSEHMGKKVSVEADVIGMNSGIMQYPKKITVQCPGGNDSKACLACTMSGYINPATGKNERTMIIGASSNKIIGLLGSSYQTIGQKIKMLFGIDSRCDVKWFADWENARVIHLASRMSNEFKVEDQPMRLNAYHLGKEIDLNRGYRFIGYVWPHPRTLIATFFIEDKIPLQSNLATFSLEKDQLKELKVFQVEPEQTPLDKVKQINEAFANNFAYIFGREQLFLAMDLVYHSARWIPFQRRLVKGWLDILVMGDTGQAKSTIAEEFMRHYDLGTMAAGETSSRTGLLYSIQILKGEEAWVSFGLLPRANGYLVVVDEVHGMSARDFREFTLVRSKGVVDVKRVAWGIAAAETRLISIANARPGMSMASYGYPVQAIVDVPCFQALEDVRRFDFAVGVKAGDVDIDTVNTDVRDIKAVYNPYTTTLCKNLILWVWTRTPEQITVEQDTETAILGLAKSIAAHFVPDIPLVETADIRLKLLRIATAFAGRTFSTEDGINLIVREEHAIAAYDVLLYFYNATGLDYIGYSDDAKAEELTPEQRKKLATDFKLRFPEYAKICRWLLNTSNWNKSQAQTSLPITKQTVDQLLSVLLECKFIAVGIGKGGGYSKTPAGREFIHSIMDSSPRNYLSGSEVLGGKVEEEVVEEEEF